MRRAEMNRGRCWPSQPCLLVLGTMQQSQRKTLVTYVCRSWNRGCYPDHGIFLDVFRVQTPPGHDRRCRPAQGIGRALVKIFQNATVASAL